jgi:3-methyl-2-oxobutanoate hydroxymethyltransferase
VLVINDALGLTTGHTPKFARRYANLSEIIARAAAEYCDDVRNGRFPSDEESYHLPAELRSRFLARERA